DDQRPPRHHRPDRRGGPAAPAKPPGDARPPRLLAPPGRDPGFPARPRPGARRGPRENRGGRMMARRLVVIGAGMASGRMLEHLLDGGGDGWDVTLFNAEPRGNYNRLMLSPVLSGEKTYAEIVTHDADWYAARGIDCR